MIAGLAGLAWLACVGLIIYGTVVGVNKAWQDARERELDLEIKATELDIKREAALNEAIRPLFTAPKAKIQEPKDPDVAAYMNRIHNNE